MIFHLGSASLMRFVKLLCATALLLAINLTSAEAGLIVDFGVSTTTTASPVAAGAVNGNTLDNPAVPGDPYPVPQPLTVLNLSGIPSDIGTISVHGDVTMSSGEVPLSTFRAINRTPAVKTAAQNPGLNNNTDNDDFLRDWISVTQFTTTTGGVITNNPAPTLTFTISGLIPGQYKWTSWHHDIEDQSGLINYTFTDASGASTGVIDVSHGVANSANTGSPTPNFVNGRGAPVNGTGDPISNPPGTPTSFSKVFTVDGSGSFTFAMSSGFDPALMSASENLPNSSGSLNFAVINGFEVTQVPEPASIVLLGFSAFLAMLVAKRRRK
jgi:hypothetical protein